MVERTSYMHSRLNVEYKIQSTKMLDGECLRFEVTSLLNPLNLCLKNKPKKVKISE